jgi:deazaflavin-dependent oxidoreductase (nitroreductase family)
MFETVVASLVVIGVIVAGVAVAFVVGMRAKSRLLFAPLIGLQRRVLNPVQLRTAGRPGAYAGIVRHVGRRSGRTYETPVGILADGDGFLIALPYGSRTQWLQNVVAAGTGELVTEGRTVVVDRPQIIPARDVAAQFSITDQRMFRLFATTDCLRLRARVEPANPALDRATLAEARVA